MILALDRKTGKIDLGARRQGRNAARGLASRQRHVGIGVGRDRRRAHHRVVRVARILRLRHERQARLAEGSRRQADAHAVRRGQHAGALRQSPRRRLGSPGPVVHRRARQADRRRNCGERTGPRSTRGRRRSSSTVNGRAQVITGAMNQVRELRPRDRRRRLVHVGPHDESDSVAGVRRRDGVSHERLPRQQPQGDSARARRRATSPARPRSRGRSTATRRTCRRRCSTTTSSTS